MESRNFSTMSTMSKSKMKNSVMQVASLKPEFEFEVIKLVLLRESYVQRLQRHLESTRGDVDMSIVGLFDVLRDCSIEIVDTIRKWERTQVDYPLVKPFLWNGIDYLIKMIDDLKFLGEYPQISVWLGFEYINNPFIVPPELLLPAITVPADSYLVFGHRPEKLEDKEAKRPKAVKTLKSPYLTPIINNAEIFPAISQAAKIEKAEKKRTKKSSGIISESEVSHLKDKSLADPFETFLSSAMMNRVRKCWEILCSRRPNLNEDTLSKTFGHLFEPERPPWTTSAGILEGSFVSEMGNTMEVCSTHQEIVSFDLVPSVARDLSIRSPDDPQAFDDDSTKKSRLDGQAMFLESIAIAGRLSPERPNQSYRITSLDDFALARTGLGSLKSHVWTPHEINLQRVVQKKGGELFVITAAGTQGRKLAPWRKSRFERLEDDYQHIQQQHDQFSMTLADVESNQYEIQYRLEKVREAEKKVTDKQFEVDSCDEPATDSLDTISSKKIKFSALPSKDGRVSSPLLATSRSQSRKISSTATNQAESATITKSIAKDEGKVHSKSAIASPAANPTTQATAKVELIKTVSREVTAEANLREVKFHLETQRKLMSYQIDYFKRIMDGGAVASMEKTRKMRKLEDGVPLETDESLSMSLEDVMATKIQRKIRIVFGRLIRKSIAAKQRRAAIIIQRIWRRITFKEIAIKRKHQAHLAILMQRLFRGRRGVVAGTEMKMMSLQLASAKLIQRAYRGYKGRVRTTLKTEFLTEIVEADQRVSFIELTPGDIDDLADVLELYLKDFEMVLPMAVLNTMRAVMYMFNGEKGEQISVDIENGGGYIHLKARTLSWDHARLILRRKGRFLRRLRALIRRVMLPDAGPLEFTEDCVVHLAALKKGTDMSVFLPIGKGRKAIIQIFRYVQSITRIQELQHHFPEYFAAGQPSWFRKLCSLRLRYEQADLTRLVEQGCEERLEFLRQEIVKAGKKFGSVAHALSACKTAMFKCKMERIEAKKYLDNYIRQLEIGIHKRVAVMENLVRTRELGLSVAQNELRLYQEVAVAIDPKKMKLMYREIDRRALDLLDTQATIITSKKGMEVDQEARDFDRSLKFDEVKERCLLVGKLKADLMVTAETWRQFLDTMGGAQFLPDLVGEKKEYYMQTRERVLDLMKQRRDALSFIEKNIKLGFEKAKRHAQRAKRRFLDHAWDAATDVEVEFEVEEDIEWARRDADALKQEGKLATQVEIDDAPFTPVLALVDKRLPAEFISELSLRAIALSYFVISDASLDTQLMITIQSKFDEKENVLLFVDRGVHRMSRGRFVAAFNALVTGLIPSPRVVAIDCSTHFTAHTWHGRLRLNQSLTKSGGSTTEDYDAMIKLGKIRQIAAVMREGLKDFDSAIIPAEIDEDLAIDDPSVPSTNDESNYSDDYSGSDDISTVDAAAEPNDFNHGRTSIQGSRTSIQSVRRRGSIGSRAGSATGSQTRSRSNSAAESLPRSRGGSHSGSQADSNAGSRTGSHAGSHTGSRAGSQQGGSVAGSQSGRSISQAGSRRGSHHVPRLETMLENDYGDTISEVPLRYVDDGTGNYVPAGDDDVQDAVSEGSNGDFVISTDFPFLPEWLADRFVADLHSLYRSLLHDPHKQKYLTILTTSHNQDKLVAAMISSVLGLWKAPVSKWTDAQINIGCLAFMDYLGTPRALYTTLAMRVPPECGMFSIRRLEEAIKIAQTWGKKIKISFYSHPVRFLLLQWVLAITDLMNCMARAGGEVYHDFKNTKVDFCRYIDWDGDILSGDGDGVLGDIGCIGLEPYKVYENNNCPVMITVISNNFDDLEKQVTESRTEYHRVRVYYCGKYVYVAVEMTKITGKVVNYVTRREMSEVIRMFSPNAIEVCEGRVRLYRIEEGGKDKWYELLAQWSRIDFTGERPICRLLRNRSLLFSWLGKVDGFEIRLEVFEERHGEAVLLIHNLLPSGATITYYIDRERLTALSKIADVWEEKGKLQVVDFNSISMMFADRLKCKPHFKVWRLLHDGDLQPSVLRRNLTVSTRLTGGPGRLCGRKLIQYNGLSLVFVLYELSNANSEFNVNAIRLQIYDLVSCATVEYRFSALERLVLFPSDEVSIIEQIEARLRIVYCNRNDSHRTLLNLPGNTSIPKQPFVVDGTQEYDIFSPVEIFARAADDDARSAKSSRSRASRLTADESSVLGMLSEDTSTKASMIGGAHKEMLLSRARNESWGWALYFNRTLVDIVKGNLKISLGLDSVRCGFSFHCYDPRSHREAYRFISFKEACTIFYEKTEESLTDELRALDETTVYEPIDELIDSLDIETDEDDNLVYCMVSSKDDNPSIPLVYIREHIAEPDEENLRIVVTPKSKVPVMKSFSVQVHEAKGLTKLGTFGSRSTHVVVWWNGREVGRTAIAPKTNNPKWDLETSRFQISYDVANDFRQFSLEFEVIDSNVQKHKPDFMGCVSFTGDELIKFLLGEKASFTLGKSSKFDAAGNKLVAGKLIVSAIAPVIAEQFPEIVLQLEEEKSKAAAIAKVTSSTKDQDSPSKVSGLFSKITPLKSVGGWLSRKKPAATEAESIKSEVEPQPATPAIETVEQPQPIDEGSWNSSDQGSDIGSTLASVFDEIDERGSCVYLSITHSEHLPAGKLIISFNGIDTGEIDVPECSTTTAAIGAHVKLAVPPSLRASDCSITVEFWDESLTFFWGEIDVRGPELMRMISGNDIELQWVAFDSTLVPKRVNGSRAARKVVNGRICVGACCIIGPVGQPRTYNLDITSASNLLEQADIHKKSMRDFRCELFLNHELVGSTGVAAFNPSNLVWDWSEGIGESSTLSIQLFKSRPAICSLLRLNILDCGSDEVIGFVILSGSDLVSFLENTSSGPLKLAIDIPVVTDSKMRQSTMARRANESGRVRTFVASKSVDPGLDSIDDASVLSNGTANKTGEADNGHVPMDIDDNGTDNFIQRVLVLNCRRTDLVVDSTSVVDFDALSIADSQTLQVSGQFNGSVNPSQSQSISQQGDVTSSLSATTFVQGLSEQCIDVAIHEMRITRPLELIGGPRDAPLGDLFVSVYFNNAFIGETKAFAGSPNGTKFNVSEWFWNKALPVPLFTGTVSRGHFLDESRMTIEIVQKQAATKTNSLGISLPQFVSIGRLDIARQELMNLFVKSRGCNKAIISMNIAVPIPEAEQGRLRRAKKSTDDDESIQTTQMKAEVVLVCDYEVVDEYSAADRRRRAVTIAIKGLKNLVVPSSIRNQRQRGIGAVSSTKALSLQGDQQSDIAISIRWNGQEVFRVGSLPYSSRAKSCGMDVKAVMYVPSGWKLHQCLLEIVAWKGRGFLGSMSFTGKRLVKFFLNSMVSELGAERKDSTISNENIRSGNNDEIAELATTESVEKFMFSWLDLYSLKKLPGVSGTDAAPLSAERSPDRKNDPLAAVGSFAGAVRIAGEVHPYVLVVQDEPDRINLRDILATDSRRPDRGCSIQYIGTSLKHRQSNWEHYFKNVFRANIRTEKVKVAEPNEKHKVELAAAVQLKRISKVKDTDRVTWRGRVAPKQLVVASGDNDSSSVGTIATALLHRTAKLHKLQPISHMKVLGDVYHIKVDGDGIARNAGEMPIIVKEGLSSGPGLVTGAYRIEIFGNNNTVLGGVEISSDQDLELVAGVAGRHLFAGKVKEEWDKNAIFEFVVRERLILEMLPTMRKNNLKETKGRREGVSVQSEAHAGSNVSLLRDDPKDVFGASHKFGTADNRALSDEESSLPPKKCYWIRIAARTHKVAGSLLRSFVVLEGFQPAMQTSPDNFFAKLDQMAAIRELTLIIRCTDKKLGQHTELRLTGQDVLAWMPAGFPIDLRTKFKRKLLGTMVIEGISLRFDPYGKYTLDLTSTELAKFLGGARRSSLNSGSAAARRRTAYKTIEELDSASEQSDSEATSDNDDDDASDEADDKFGSAAVFGKVADVASNFVANLGGMAADVVDKLSTLLGTSRPSSAANKQDTPVAGALLSGRPVSASLSGQQSARSRPTSGSQDAVAAAAANYRAQQAAAHSDIASSFASALESGQGGAMLGRRAGREE